jgi:two-component system phosphate regulon sensor histidine kinase PhoR
MKKIPFIQTFFARAFINYLVIIVSVFLVMYLFSQGTIKNFYIENLKTHLKQVGLSLKPKVVDLYEQEDWSGLDKLAKETGREVDIRITLIAPGGRVIADSQNDPRQMENHGDRPEIIDALRGKIDDATSIRFSSTEGEPMLYLALPVERKKEKPGETHLVIRLSLYLSEVKQLTRELGWQFTGVLLVLFLIALTMAWFFSRGISRPVKEIAKAAAQFASGDFDVKIFLEKKDELAQVAESFNDMVVEQKSLFDKLSRSRAELQTIICTMKEGLLVLDHQGKITLWNGSFRELSGKKDFKGHPYWEILRVPDFENHVKRAFKSMESFYEEVEIAEKAFLVGFNPMEAGEKKNLVIIFRDITGYKQLEQLKKDFVVNLTHELKTPLTAIKGFIETLEMEENIKNTRYIDIIKRHTDRMNQIVSDLLILSELEEKKRQVTFEPLNLEDILTNILKIYQEKIKEKNLELEMNIEPGLPPVPGEKFKIEQMFINLVDNAVKYTEEGKISIAIAKETRAANHFVNIRVTNTGLPIPEKSLPRLFDRFYVVDKSRSRKLGGTGLGLSIVKHVVLLHNGQISVENVENEGTAFSILLPYEETSNSVLNK